MSKKKEHHEEHPDETWLIPYADMLTLLLALFIVMFASSQMDKNKFDEMKSQFGGIFSNTTGISVGKQGIHTVAGYPGGKSAAAIEGEKIDEMVKYLNEEIQKSGYEGQIKTEIYRDGLEISIQDSVLFNSGDAVIVPKIAPMLSTIAGILQGIDNDVRVIGHTDSIPINNVKFKSNWELSAIRAINVMNYLVQAGSLNENRFIIQGNGEYKPKADNLTEEGRAKNRRVEIFIIRRHAVPETLLLNAN